MTDWDQYQPNHHFPTLDTPRQRKLRQGVSRERSEDVVFDLHVFCRPFKLSFESFPEVCAVSDESIIVSLLCTESALSAELFHPRQG